MGLLLALHRVLRHDHHHTLGPIADAVVGAIAGVALELDHGVASVVAAGRSRDVAAEAGRSRRPRRWRRSSGKRGAYGGLQDPGEIVPRR